MEIIDKIEIIGARKYEEKTDDEAKQCPWASWLPRVQFSMNCARQETMKDAPNRLVFGRSVRPRIFPGAMHYTCKCPYGQKGSDVPPTAIQGRPAQRRTKGEIGCSNYQRKIAAASIRTHGYHMRGANELWRQNFRTSPACTISSCSRTSHFPFRLVKSFSSFTSTVATGSKSKGTEQ